jgi:hypothetical protein
MSGGMDMMRSTPINALRRDELQDPQTRDMVDGIVNELEYPGGLPGGNGGGDNYEGMHGNPQMMDYGVPDGGYGGSFPPEYSGISGLPPGDPRGGQQFPGDGQYPQYPQHPQQYEQHPQHPQHPPQRMDMGQSSIGGGSGGSGVGSGGMFNNLTELLNANMKEPMLAAILYVIMSNDTVSMLLSRYIPYASSPMFGLLIRAALIAVIFFLTKIFVLRR